MNEIDDISTFVHLKTEEESLSTEKDWDSSLPFKLTLGSRPIGRYGGNTIIQLPDGSFYKT
mgnify:CR=1 FL=1